MSEYYIDRLEGHMSSKIFETQLYIKSYKDTVIKELIAFGVSDLYIKSIDNWQYENETQINQLADIDGYVNNGKIVVIEGKFKDCNCGCYVYKLADDCYEFDFWVPTKIDRALDDECVSERNSYVYDAVIDLLKKCVDPLELLFCVSGIEMCVEYSNDLNQVLDNGSGILQLICLRNTINLNKLSLNVKQYGDYVVIKYDMININRIEKYKFDLDNYVLRLGEYYSYNAAYYSISLTYNNELINIGLQTPDTGILPQVVLHNDHIIIGASESVYIWEPDMSEPICYELDAPFYEFFIVADTVIIVYELGVIALNKNFKKKWEQSFSEIIDIEKLDKNILILKDFCGKIIKLDMLTGECI